MDRKTLLWIGAAAAAVLAVAALYIAKHGAIASAMVWAGLVFVVGSAVIVVGTLQWLARVDKHALLRSEEKIQNKDALVIGAFFTLLLLLAYCIAAAAAAMQFPGQAGAAVLLTLTWALASASVGGAFGFLLGHPRRLMDEKPERTGLTGLLRTGLDDMVDWLVKGLTTVLLVEAGPILVQLEIVGKNMARGLLGAGATPEALDSAAAFAQPLIVCFTLLGALATCLVTRTFLTGALTRADRTTTGAFGRVGLDLGEVLVLSNAQHFLTTRGVPPDAAVRQVAEKLSALSLADLHTVREFAMWAKSKSMLEQYEDALKGYEKAIAECDCDPALLLDYAVALHAAKKQAEALVRLRLAYEHLGRATEPDTRRNVYKSYTFELLYEPGSYDRVIKLVDEFERDRENSSPASGGLFVNKACAYGQKFLWLAKQKNLIDETPGKPFRFTLPDAPPNWPTEHSDLKAAYEGALEAVRRTIDIDPTWKKHLQILLERPEPTQKDPRDFSGLEVFERFTEMRRAVDLPPYSEAAPAPSQNQVAATAAQNPSVNVAVEQTDTTKNPGGDQAS
jgi:tetratricopeptide (TPR) repeat protein